MMSPGLKSILEDYCCLQAIAADLAGTDEGFHVGTKSG